MLLLALLARSGIAQDPAADKGDAEGGVSQQPPDATSRLDFGIDWFQTADGRVATGGLQYTWAPLTSHSFGAGLPLVDSGISNTEGSGIGDLQFQYNYVPSRKLTANPWVPNSLGLGLGLVVPTGNLEDGTGAGEWVVTPSLGWAWRVGKGFVLLPQAQYSYSFSEEPGVVHTELLAVRLVVLYVWKKLFWVQYSPGFGRDMENGVQGFLHKLVVGHQFTRRLGSSLDFASITHDIPGNEAVSDSTTDYRLTLEVHWILAF